MLDADAVPPELDDVVAEIQDGSKMPRRSSASTPRRCRTGRESRPTTSARPPTLHPYAALADATGPRAL
jgi:hypothetical protein